MSAAVTVRHVSKVYRLGVVGGGTLHGDLSRWWARVRKQPDPYLPVNAKARTSERGDTLMALRDVCIEVQEGEAVGIIGRNGAGKSTLLKILSRVTAPSSGTIKMRGRVGSLLEVGTGFHPELTGRENIFLNGAMLGMSRAEIRRKLDDIVGFADVGPYLETPVKRYSSGMYVRLAFAVAAFLEPEILLVDEVLAVGDHAFQQQCLGRMKDVASHGRTVLFVSHNMASIQNLTQRLVLLQDGAVAFVGPTTDGIQRYLAQRPSSSAILGARSDRTGIEPGVLRSVSLVVDGVPTDNTAISGLPLQVKIEYDTSSDGRLEFFMAVYDQMDRRIVHMNSMQTGLRNEPAPKRGVATCSIPRLALAPGKYSIALAIDANGETLDRVEGACDLFVAMGDFFGTGRHEGSDWGLFLFDHEWAVEG
jgi:lipopolysaccharide transport system ATP-binding protein